ncbi:MAG: GNAT family N-acetyltransferase [Bacteroidota bacterium]
MQEYYIELSDERITLKPLRSSDIDQMKKICGDPVIWKWFTADLADPSNMEKWMSDRLNASEEGSQMTYAVVLNEHQQVAGSSSYGHINWKEKALEIGWTWLGADYIGSGINKHMKFLMLSHAFDTMEIERVEIRTDEINVRSRRAIEKIGTQLDGTLRSHRQTLGNRRRNTVVYSIIKEEWNEIRTTIFKEF